MSHVSIAASNFITEHRTGSELHEPKKVLFHVTRTLFRTCRSFNKINNILKDLLNPLNIGVALIQKPAN